MPRFASLLLLLAATPALADGGTQGALNALGDAMLVFALILLAVGLVALVLVVRAMQSESSLLSRMLAMCVLAVLALGFGLAFAEEVETARECEAYFRSLSGGGEGGACWDLEYLAAVGVPLTGALLSFGWIAMAGRRRRAAGAPPDPPSARANEPPRPNSE